MLIDDLLYHTKQENLDGTFFAADMEKVFDSLEHNFIYETFKKNGFREDFIQWIRTLLCNASICVMNNRFSTGYFNLNRGIRQGDPLSAYLFFLCPQVLLVRIRNDASVRGFKFDKIEIKLTYFVDNVALLVKDVSSIKNWRPISLMNVDTKIASKALALRMKKSHPYIINYDQTLKTGS